MNILFFGDSITYGEHDEQGGGYVDILKRYCHQISRVNKTREINCFNLGIGGETTEGALKRFETEIKSRISGDEIIIFISYGANDLAQKDGKFLVDKIQFESNYSELIRISKNYSRKVYAINILPISKSVDNVEIPNRKFRNDETIQSYNQIIEKLAKESDIHFIDLYSVFEQNKEDYLSNDGVHPNSKGYNFIANQLKPIID